MGIQLTLDGQMMRLYIEGDIYQEHAEILRAIISDRVRDGSRLISLNMVGVYYIDCISLQLLANLGAQLKNKGVSLVFEQAREWKERLRECSACTRNDRNECKGILA